MIRRNLLGIAVITALSLSLLPGNAIAQQKTLKDQLVGMWTLVSETDITSDGKKSEGFGPNPLGAYIFDAGGHFAQMLMRADLPKFDNRLQGTPDQNKAVAQGSVAYYGTYTV